MVKKIQVNKSVLVAAKKLQNEATIQSKAHHIAQNKLGECKSAGDVIGKHFWRDVWLYLMLVEYEPGEIEIIDDEGGG